MSFGTSMKDLAVDLIESFSEEIGTSQLKYITSNGYNPTSGVVETIYAFESAYMVYLNLSKKEVPNESYLLDNSKVIVSDLTNKPKINDIIVKPNGDQHRIVNVLVDQYGAASILHVEKKVL